jgi:hypothetical protein
MDRSSTSMEHGTTRGGRPRRAARQAALAAGAAWLAGVAAAQQPGTIARSNPLRPVEPAVGDIGPLRISLRELRTDFRAPSAFDTVYRLPGAAPGHEPAGDLLFRRDGALTAAFPRSVYATTKGGTRAIVPPGTIYYIGEGSGPLRPAEAPAAPPGPTRVADARADGPVSTQAATRTDPAAPAGPEHGPRPVVEQDRTRVLNVFLDADYSDARVRQILSASARPR